MEHAAPGEAGKRASEGSASTSVNAFELFRINSDVLSRVTDAASNQRLVDAPAKAYRSESDFPGVRNWRPSARYTRVRPRGTPPTRAEASDARG